MFERVVLGVDPGTSAVGLAVVGAGPGPASVVWWKTIRTQATEWSSTKIGRAHV